MPELPEVETICKGITPIINSNKITDVIQKRNDLRWPLKKDIKNNLVGKECKEPFRIGKYILIPINNNFILLIHLGMSGRLRIFNKHPIYKKHDHFSMCLNAKHWIVYSDPRRFGFIDLFNKKSLKNHFLLKNLGMDALSNELNTNWLLEKFKNKKTSIKNVLLNQNILAGIGNIYCNEILFAAKIHPNRLASSIEKENVEKLIFFIKNILKNAIKAGGTTIKDHLNPNGEIGYFKNELKVYGKLKMGCVDCKQKIKEKKISGRSTYYCSFCQK